MMTNRLIYALPLIVSWILLFGNATTAWGEEQQPVRDENPGLASSEFSFDPNDTQLARNFRLKIGGWLNFGLVYNAEQPADHFNGPVSFADRSNEFLFNQLYLFIERKALARSGEWDFGGRLDFVFGSDALFTRSLGDPANHWDSHLLHQRIYGIAFPQIYLEIATPIGRGLRVKIGEFYTIIGVESVMAPDNFFYTHSYAMQYGEPFSHVGILTTYPVAEGLELKAGAMTFSPLGG
ncbi:MAG: outer membrane beta-barrel protein, partial [Candidatus Methylumidiphilus sp.]